MQLINIQVELTEREAWNLAQFIKRLRIDQCHELTDSGFSRQDRQDQAFEMLAAIDKIGTALKHAISGSGHAVWLHPFSLTHLPLGRIGRKYRLDGLPEPRPSLGSYRLILKSAPFERGARCLLP